MHINMVNGMKLAIKENETPHYANRIEVDLSFRTALMSGNHTKSNILTDISVINLDQNVILCVNYKERRLTRLNLKNQKGEERQPAS